MSTEDDGFIDFGVGVEDDGIKKKARNFKAKDNTSYYVSFANFSVPTTGPDGKVTWDDDAAFTKDGINPKAIIRWKGCRRIFVDKVGYVLYKNASYADLGGNPKDAIGTILVIWPSDDEGELDEKKMAAGKGWTVVPWVMGDMDKYNALKKAKRNPTHGNDFIFTCPENGSEFQKLTFAAAGEHMLKRLFEGTDEEKATARRIVAEIRTTASRLSEEMAQDLTVAQVRAKMSGDSGASATSKTSSDVDDLLDDVAG